MSSNIEIGALVSMVPSPTLSHDYVADHQFGLVLDTYCDDDRVYYEIQWAAAVDALDGWWGEHEVTCVLPPQ